MTQDNIERLEAEERRMDAVRQYCESMMSKRRNAESGGVWRAMISASRSYAESCGSLVDRFMISKAYEDVVLGYRMVQDDQAALRWVERCLSLNGQAAGCYLKKAELIWAKGRLQESRNVVSRGIAVANAVIIATRFELETTRKRRPRADAAQVERRRFLRLVENLEDRLTYVEQSLNDLNELQEYQDTQ